MSDILLTTLNARYHHASFGLRYLKANLGELRDRTTILEFTTKQWAIDVAEEILSHNPKIVGVGVYIWNAEESEELVELLKQLRPDLPVVIGGPEVSHEVDDQHIVGLADYTVTGEGDHAFQKLCHSLLAGEPPEEKIIAAKPPQPETLELPYDLYDDEDVANRVTYVEASRGCPFRCEFCLSSLARGVRAFDLDRFLVEMETLLDRGVKRFKFVDRTFNLRVDTTTRILSFFLERHEPDHFIHFEMVPDRLPQELRELIVQFPVGTLQFEVGVQTFDPEVAKRISRRQDYDKLADNLRFLREETGVHVHADLIAGLPGEDLEMFGRGFDRLVELGPQEIQVGILKRLRGTPIARHTEEFGMVYSPRPPYEILENDDVGFEEMQQMRRFSRFWDLVSNSGNFLETTPLIWGEGSPFEHFFDFSRWIFERTHAVHGIALKRLARYLFEYLDESRDLDEVDLAKTILRDYQRPGRPDVPGFLKDFIPDGYDPADDFPVDDRRLPSRQSRHLG